MLHCHILEHEDARMMAQIVTTQTPPSHLQVCSVRQCVVRPPPASAEPMFVLEQTGTRA
jgi:hypothetical protein